MNRSCRSTARARVGTFLAVGILSLMVPGLFPTMLLASSVPGIVPAPGELIPASHQVRPASDSTTEAPPGPVPTVSPPMVSPPPAVPPIDCRTCEPLKGETPSKSWEMIWNNGLYFQTADKEFTFHTGATLQYDGAWYTGSTALQQRPMREGVGGTGRFDDGTNLRRGRFWFEGTLYGNVDYKFEMEFFNGIGFSPAGTQGNVVASSLVNSPGPTDAWINIKDIPFIGNLRIGSQKEWFSLEHLEVYRYLPFMERSYLFDFSQMTAFNNGFSPGISMWRTWADSRVFSALGFYKNESDLIGFGIGDGQYALTGRLAFLPYYNPEQQSFWHVGGAFSHRDPVDDQVQIRIRDNVRNAPFALLNLLLNTGQVPTRSQDLFNVETAFVNGPLTLQAEYTANILRGVSTTRAPNGPNLGNYMFQGVYGSAMYFLTGESRTWNTTYFFYNRVVPKKNFAFKKDGLGVEGWGAWEIGARYTYLNVTDKDVQAGMLNAATLGLNWYLNPNCRFQFNYDYTYRAHNADPLARGAIHSFGSRFSLDF